MPPELIFPLDRFDHSRLEVSKEELQKYCPQRFEMSQCDGIIGIDPVEGIALGVRDIRADEFWVRGHIPGRPLFPAVLMLEAAAQVSTFLIKRKGGLPPDAFMGFAGIEKARFRAPLQPGDRLLLLARNEQIRGRMNTTSCQGVVGDKLAFECIVMGLIF